MRKKIKKTIIDPGLLIDEISAWENKQAPKINFSRGRARLKPRFYGLCFLNPLRLCFSSGELKTDFSRSGGKDAKKTVNFTFDLFLIGVPSAAKKDKFYFR